MDLIYNNQIVGELSTENKLIIKNEFIDLFITNLISGPNGPLPANDEEFQEIKMPTGMYLSIETSYLDEDAKYVSVAILKSPVIISEVLE